MYPLQIHLVDWQFIYNLRIDLIRIVSNVALIPDMAMYRETIVSVGFL